MRALKLLLTVSAFATYFVGLVAFSAVTMGAIHAWCAPRTVPALLADNEPLIARSQRR
jgi:hypothetical protein